MEKRLFLSSSDVMSILGVSRAQAYRIIKTLNDDLMKNGYFTVSGKVSRKFFEEKFYGAENCLG